MKAPLRMPRVLPAALPLFICLLATMSARAVFSPLLLEIESTFGISHGVAGLLFLAIAAGYVPGMLLSGFISARLGHRRTILTALGTVVAGLLVVAATPWVAGAFCGVTVLGFGAGLYFPSGVAVVTRAVSRPQWGRALAVHEAGPNTGMLLAPLLSVAVLSLGQWRHVLLAEAGWVALTAVVFAATVRRSRFRGRPPTLSNILPLVRSPGLWPLVGLMVMAAGATMGLYAVLPAFLQTERGLPRELSNALVSASRIASLAMVFTAGYLVDRLGRWHTLLGGGLVAAMITVCVGLLGGPALVVGVILQPLGAAAIFPAAFTVLADLGPPQMRNVVISLVVPFVYGLGAGLVPALLGLSGDGQGFAFGITILGGVFLLAVAVVAVSRARLAGRPVPARDPRLP